MLKKELGESHGIVVLARPSVKAQAQGGLGSTPRQGQKNPSIQKKMTTEDSFYLRTRYSILHSLKGIQLNL